MQNLGVKNKEYYGMLWYFLEWSILQAQIFFETGMRINIALECVLTEIGFITLALLKV